MPVERCTIEELIPKDRPTARQRIATARHGQKPSNRRRRPRSSHQSRVRRSGDPMIREVFDHKPRSITLCCVAGSTQDCLRSGTTTVHRLGDPLPLHWVHESCCIANQEHLPHRWRCPDDPHLEPATKASLRCCCRLSVEETEYVEMLKKRGQRSNRICTSLAV
jgi:hypothetical protein